ncbi:hypothetical protein [Microbulbifer sp. PAAF003]|uniref:hypothetical protein n=1 Tax=Microbulbifer sp. PAAF003 TaxID=3243375 RepID=UPI0040393D01
MKYILIILALMSSLAAASGGPKEVSLTPELAAKLGFHISVKPEGPAIMFELRGQKESPSGCPASRSGTFLLGKNSEELLVHITELPTSKSEPEAIGYFTDSKHTMGVFIDYLCKGEKVLKSVRYTVQSTSDWLITSKGTGRSKTAPVL